MWPLSNLLNTVVKKGRLTVIDVDGSSHRFGSGEDGPSVVMRLHYYYTLRDWRIRFTANRDKAKELYDERFCRMWEFYLGAAELGFLHGSNMVFQLLLSPQRDAVPVNRNFIVDAEREMRPKAS